MWRSSISLAAVIGTALIVSHASWGAEPRSRLLADNHAGFASVTEQPPDESEAETSPAPSETPPAEAGKEPISEDTLAQESSPHSILATEADLFGPEAPQSYGEGRRATPNYLDYDNGYERMSEGAYDAVGGYMGDGVRPAGRPLYPYGADEYWYGHDADVESWGDLLELPKVGLGWFGSADVTAVKMKADPEFTSATRLDKVFPGNPVTLGTAHLNWTAMPRIELGYRYEHGLGELRAEYRYLSATGTDHLSGGGFDSADNATIHTSVQGHVFDFDFAILEFNAEGLPDFPMLARSPARLGLGRAPTSNLLCPPLEIRWRFGTRIARLNYESIGQGDLKRETVANNFVGAGLHFVLDLDQRLPTKQPLFFHAKMEGSGMFGYVDQEFSRTQFQPVRLGARNGFRDGTGIPTALIELGLSWVPEWPERNVRYTASYFYEEWFSLGQAADSNLDLYMHGIMFRAEHKF